MKISDDQKFAYTCQDAGELLFLYAVWPQELSISEREETPKHLIKCPDCRFRYEKLKQVAPAIRENPEILYEFGFTAPEREDSSQRPTQAEINQARFEARLERAGLRRKRREKRERIAEIKRIAKRASAIAACLIAVFGLYVTVNYLTGNNNAAPKIAANPNETQVKIELLSDTGSEILPADRPIIAANNIKTLKINDNRSMVLNIGTELSIVPHNLGCIVKLNKGEIYTEVQHDGRPFIVETTHGRAVITGTIFNIKADDKQMELAVTEGTVKFEGEDAYVNVTANYKSTLTANAKPTAPELCDTKTLTAWITGLDTPNLAKAALEQEINLDPAFLGEQINLDRIDYTSWIEQKRPWFKREFPHIFKFKQALAKEGIEVDYPELLIKSGDLWRFAFPEKTNTQLIPVNYKSMLKLASVYSKDAEWLHSNLNITESDQASYKTPSLKSLDKWIEKLNETLESNSAINTELLTNSLHASVYLKETRTLTWLAVNTGQIKFDAAEKKKLATLLNQQIELASSCIQQFKRLFISTYSSSTCDEDKQLKSLQNVMQNIELIKETERKISENETFSK